MLNKRLEAIAAYLKQVGKDLTRGDSTEHTHRPALQQLIQQLQKGIVCVNEPKGSSAAGHPDMKVLLGDTPLGFIETKDVGLDLDEIADTPQLKRYLKHIPNLILTDYLEFRWYQNGNLADTVRLAIVLGSGKLRRYDKGGESLLTLLDNFLTADVKTVGSPKELAERMATLAKWVRRVIVESFEAESAGQELHSQLKAFREVLLPDLDVPKFADMYAQTICYGLFAGKCNADPGIAFARDNAASYLPRTNPFLRKLFSSIMAGDLNEKVAGAIDAITFLLDHADVGAILKDFNKRTRREDPVVHFYETFLAAYDPRLRKTRGVYYTPEPVVSYIVRSVDWLLKEKFGKKDGLADPSVLVLDPACGTGTFLYHVIKLIHERVKAKGQYGSWSSYVRDSLLPRVFGFELLMAPYAVAHLKLGLLLRETGYDFGSDERLGIFLTNTLEEAAKKSDVLFAQYISDEANAATDIKRDKPIMVILGNPPYSKHSANNGDWIRRLVHDYYIVDGQPLGERNPKWLQDDYVKFIRWSQWRIAKTGYGIHGFITNNGYLDNPTFRGMRQQLMKTFDELHLLDLHGNANKGDVSPDGSADKNVFDIKQGVGIGIFVRTATARRERDGTSTSVLHSDLWGTRETKYRILSAADAKALAGRPIIPNAPAYLFIPRDERLRGEYEDGLPVGQVFPLNAVGFQTHRDYLVMSTDGAELRRRIGEFVSPDLSTDQVREKFFSGQPQGKYPLGDTRDWKLTTARDALCDQGKLDSYFTICLRSPFNYHHYFDHPAGVDYGRPEVMGQLRGKYNVALLWTRPMSPQYEFSVFCGNCPIDQSAAGNKAQGAGGTYVGPLYVYLTAGQKGQQRRLDETQATPWPPGKGGRVPNLSPKFVAEMEAKLSLKFVPEGAEGSLECGSEAAALSQSRSTGKAGAALPQSKGVFTPEDVFNYIYAIFHSPTYRKRYAEFLKIDFPRVPLTSDKELFWKLVALGRELVALHLLESPKVKDFVTKYPKKGPDTVEKVTYLDPTVIPTEGAKRRSGGISSEAGETPPIASLRRGDTTGGRVYINDDQYFDGVRPEWFEFHIGGYQVLHKWLKDRKGRKLSNDDITHYQRVVVAIKETIRLMSEIDKAITKWPIE